MMRMALDCSGRFFITFLNSTEVHVVCLMIAPHFAEDCKVHFTIAHKTTTGNQFFLHRLQFSPLERKLIKKGETERFLYLRGLNVLTDFMGLQKEKVTK